MTIRTSIQVHFGPGDVSHRHRQDSYSTLDFGYLSRTDLMIHFTAPAEIDEVIAELTALRAEMTGDDEYRPTAKGEAAPVYRLACGCTDWCNCDRCRAGKIHDTGSGWHCDEHGKTAVAETPAAVSA